MAKQRAREREREGLGGGGGGVAERGGRRKAERSEEVTRSHASRRGPASGPA